MLADFELALLRVVVAVGAVAVVGAVEVGPLLVEPVFVAASADFVGSSGRPWWVNGMCPLSTD